MWSDPASAGWLLQVAAKETEITRLANDVDSLGLQLGRARGELAKQVCLASAQYHCCHPASLCACA